MDKMIIKAKLRELVQDRLHITIEDPDENFFSRRLNIPPIDMVCLLYECRELFHIEINDSFIEKLPSITLNNMAEAISFAETGRGSAGRL